MFLQNINRYIANKALKRKLKEAHLSQGIGEGKIKSFGCIVNVDEFSDVSLLYKLMEDTGIRKEQFKIIGFSKGKRDHTQYNIPIVTPKSLDWKGKIINDDYRLFSHKEYDLLLSYYGEKVPKILNLATVYTKAKFKIGMKMANGAYNHMIFDINTTSYTLFKEELIKYLTVFKKI
ncbi:DUF6913 domain-containing protein [Leptobacterium sp. I13]|uniref:DUF6913 domain-containing protein n=1 Tax=Leptobacterium meishanense TaxID=3128904 RepID=UPI0030EECCF0